MAADVNVTEKMARAIHRHMQRVRDRGDYIVGPASDEAAADALSVLADPEVQAGIAGVLRDAEDEWVRRYADAEGAPPTRSELQAAAVVEWLGLGA